MDLIIDKTISDFTLEYVRDKNLTMNEDEFHVDVFNVAGTGRFYAIYHLGDVIGSVLQYKGEVVLNGYYKEEDDYGGLLTMLN